MKKRIGCILLALAMSFSIGTIAFADDAQVTAEEGQTMTMEQIDMEVQRMVDERMEVVGEQLAGYPEVYELAYRWYLQDTYTQMLLYENGDYPGTTGYRFNNGGIIYYETSEELEEFGVDMAFSVTLLTPTLTEKYLDLDEQISVAEIISDIVGLVPDLGDYMSALVDFMIGMTSAAQDDVEEANNYAEIICIYGIKDSAYPDGAAAVSGWHEYPYKYISEDAQNVQYRRF